MGVPTAPERPRPPKQGGGLHAGVFLSHHHPERGGGLSDTSAVDSSHMSGSPSPMPAVRAGPVDRSPSRLRTVPQGLRAEEREPEGSPSPLLSLSLSSVPARFRQPRPCRPRKASPRSSRPHRRRRSPGAARSERPRRLAAAVAALGGSSLRSEASVKASVGSLHDRQSRLAPLSPSTSSRAPLRVA